MKVELLVAEIGSTTTIVNAFNNIFTSNPVYLGSGVSYTTVLEGDVNIGLNNAINDLERKLNIEKLEYNELFATSSAAGGLKMTVHGLVKDMTAKAGFEAAIGAGANIKKMTVGKLTNRDIESIKIIEPNIILVAGGVDYGEKDTALYNAKLFADSDINCPIIYAGNIVNQEEVKEYFIEKNKEHLLTITENVYPEIDNLNVEPLRKIIHNVFEKHIMNASGMEKIHLMLTGSIMPTPGAIMEASKLMYSKLGDLVCFDIGGATTDLHSVCEENEEIKKVLIAPEPLAKRTVEGDLGVFVNINNVVSLIDKNEIFKYLNINDDQLEVILKNYSQFPKNDLDKKLLEMASKQCLMTALNRHAGDVIKRYTSSGVKKVAKGKDLSNVKYVLGTGGPLTKQDFNVKIISEVLSGPSNSKLYPSSDTKILIDKLYIMASMGVVSKKYPEFALNMLNKSFSIKE